MLEHVQGLWSRRPAVMLGAIAALVFGITLLILFVAVGGDSDAPEAASLAQQTAQQQQTSQARHETVVKVDTQSDQVQAQPSDASDQAQPAQSSADADEQAYEDDRQPAAQQQDASAGDRAQAQQAQPEPLFVAGFEVQPLSQVLTETLDEDRLPHGTDGSEGGILPIDNGVVPSSGPEHRTTWELIVPSAGLKSAIVRVGKTPGGAMGSPDNPHVVGWLDSSPQPGEPGNALLAGHRDFEDVSGNVGTGVCWGLVDTEVGHQMIIRDQENEIYYVYSVVEAETVDPYDPGAARFLQDSDESKITLITCEGSFNAETHQYSHRRVVVGVLAAVAAPDA